MICFTFSLLLNSTDLLSITMHFQHICVFFLSEYENQLFKQSQMYINRCLNERPANGMSLQTLVSDLGLFKESSVPQSADNVIISDQTAEETTSNKTLRAQSPFTSVFKNIKDSTSESLSTLPINDTETPKNKFYCPEIIQFLLDQYMPYCYIWASFALKDYGVTRMSNGLVEMYNGDRKKPIKRAHPCIYLDEVVGGVDAHAALYLQEIRDQPAVVAAAVAKQAKADKAEKILQDQANITDEHKSVDVFYKPNLGIPKPTSMQSQIPMHRLEALSSQPAPKQLLNLKSKRTGCDICKIGW